MFRRLAVFTLARDASFVGLAAATFMLGFSFVPALAFAIGASIALAFSLALLIRAAWLTEQRVTGTEVWRALQPNERPDTRCARDDLQEELLRFAKSASGISISLYSISLLASISRQIGSGHAVLTASLN
jgi:hypothetical protein